MKNTRRSRRRIADNPPTRVPAGRSRLFRRGHPERHVRARRPRSAQGLRSAERDRLHLDGLRRRVHRRVVECQLQGRRRSKGDWLVKGRLDALDRPSAALLELPVARSRLLQRGHLVDVHIWLRNALLVQLTLMPALRASSCFRDSWSPASRRGRPSATGDGLVLGCSSSGWSASPAISGG